MVGSDTDASADEVDVDIVERDLQVTELDRPRDSIVVRSGDRLQWYRLGPPVRPVVGPTRQRVPNRPVDGRPSQAGR